MNVVHVVPSLDPAQGGPPAAAIGMATAQVRLGHKIRVVCGEAPGIREKIEQRYGGFLNFRDLELLFTPEGNLVQRVMGIEGRGSMASLFDGADILHLHCVWEPLVISASRVARAQQRPYGITPHGVLTTWALRRKALKKRVALALGYRRMLEQAQFIHVLSSGDHDGTRRLGLKPPLFQISLGIRPEEFEPRPTPGSFQTMRPELKGRRYIVFLSRLHPGKGLHLLGSAFEMLVSKHPDLALVVVGPDAGAEAEFRRQIQEAELSDRIILTGPLYGREKVAALCDAACFCLPSEHEACSVAILEALICGLPVVISPECDRPEVAEVNAGMIVPRHPNAIAQAIDRIIVEPQLRQAMSDAARQLALSHFTWSRVGTELIRMYEVSLANVAASRRMSRDEQAA